MTLLPHWDEAILDIRKLEDYCLSHRTRVADTRLEYSDTRLGSSAATQPGCEMFCLKPRGPASQIRCRRLGDFLAFRYIHRATAKECYGKNDLDRACRRGSAEIRHVLGAMMTATNSAKSDGPSLLHAVALLTDLPEQRLARGQVGTIVEELDETTLLVEFSDDEGRAYAIVPCPRADAP